MAIERPAAIGGGADAAPDRIGDPVADDRADHGPADDRDGIDHAGADQVADSDHHRGRGDEQADYGERFPEGEQADDRPRPYPMLRDEGRRARDQIIHGPSRRSL